MAQIVTITNPLTGQPTQVDQLDHTAQQIDDGIGFESTDYPGCYYRTVEGVTEWLNPPMVVGTEYRTTERYLGKPVYVKAVSVSSFPLGGFSNRITVSTGIPSANVDTVVRWGAYGRDGGNNITSLPAEFGNNNVIEISGYLQKYTNALVAIIQSSNKDYSAYSGTLWLAYTKTTN